MNPVFPGTLKVPAELSPVLVPLKHRELRAPKPLKELPMPQAPKLR